jgi:hypothetical protein
MAEFKRHVLALSVSSMTRRSAIAAYQIKKPRGEVTAGPFSLISWPEQCCSFMIEFAETNTSLMRQASAASDNLRNLPLLVNEISANALCTSVAVRPNLIRYKLWIALQSAHET